MNARILIVDPDCEALDAYRSALASKTASWELTTAQTAEAAFEAADANSPDITLVAFALDEQNGLNVLSQIVDRAPLTHPFIVAKDEEKDQLAHALEGGCRFLPVNCPAEQLILEFRRCLAIDNWYDNPTIKELFADQTRYRLLEQRYLQVLKALNATRPSKAQVAEAIAADLQLSNSILEVANALRLKAEDEISSLKQAVAFLGLDTVRQALLLTQLFHKVAESEESSALSKEIWHHSLSVAAAARRISLFENEDSACAGAAFSAGLLHDIGKLVLLDSDPEAFIEAQRAARDQSIPAWQAEQQRLGCDHAETGAYLLHRWGIPDDICETTALHHRPANSCSETFSALAAVHAANAIIRKRRNSKHPDASPTQAFLEEIGKADRWDDWEAVVAGQEPPSRVKAKLRLSQTLRTQEPKSGTQDEKPIPDLHVDPTTRAAHAALSQSINKAVEIRERAEDRANLLTRKSTLQAFAAGAILSIIGIHFLNSIGEDDENFPIQEARAAKESDSQGNYLSARNALMNDLMADDAKPQRITESQESTLATSVAAEALEPVVEEAPPPPPPPPPPPFPEIKLGGIFIRSTGSKAQVNGKIVGIGDRIDEAVISEIHRTSIVIEHYGREKTFHLD